MRWQVFRSVALPSAVREILTTLRVTIGVGWSALTVAELNAAIRGIGFMTASEAQLLITDVVFIRIADHRNLRLRVLALHSVSGALGRALERMPVRLPLEGKLAPSQAMLSGYRLRIGNRR